MRGIRWGDAHPSDLRGGAERLLTLAGRMAPRWAWHWILADGLDRLLTLKARAARRRAAHPRFARTR